MVTASAEELREQAIAFFREDELPAGIAWVELLPPKWQRRFAVDLSDVLKRSLMTGNLDELVQLVESWQATAEVFASPDMLAALQGDREPGDLVPLRELLAELSE